MIVPLYLQSHAGQGRSPTPSHEKENYQPVAVYFNELTVVPADISPILMSILGPSEHIDAAVITLAEVLPSLVTTPWNPINCDSVVGIIVVALMSAAKVKSPVSTRKPVPKEAVLIVP
jgi:hypothetical protein